MLSDTVDEKKRLFLKHTTAVVGCAGVAGALTPLVGYLQPSRDAKAQAAPVRVDVSQIPANGQKTVLWRGKPVWIIHRTSESLAHLANNNILKDPSSTVEQQPYYIKNQWRSLRPDYLVLLGVCTHLGCAPTYRPEPGSIDQQWPGGFYCSCHGSKFDLAGRVYKNMPAPTNLEVPPHYYESDTILVVGADGPQVSQAQHSEDDNKVL